MKPTIPERVLMVILPWTPQAEVEHTLAVAQRALEGGANWLLLRIRDLPALQCLDIAQALRSLTKDYGALFSVNPYPNLVQWVGADGVHIPEWSPVFVPREFPNWLIGRSAHSAVMARQFYLERADYLIIGNIYETLSHPHEPAKGVGLLKTVREAVPLPLIAIGGITPEKVSEVMEAGVQGVAVLSGIIGAEDPRRATEAYAKALGL